MAETVTVAHPQEGTALVTIERPEKRNALSIQVREELADALDGLLHDDELRVVVLTGSGPVFSAGFDLGEFDRAMHDEDFASLLWASSDRYHHRVATYPLPTVAAVNGPAVGGGFDLAVLCDLRVANGTAVFAHPEYAFGDVVYTPLADVVGGARARELCLTGRAVDAHEALSIGLVTEIADDVVEAALALAARIAIAPRANLMRTKAKALAHGALPEGGTLNL